MPSRQDQLHSHQFTIQRVVAALVMRETDPAQSPFRRAMGATLASVLIAAIGLGGVAAYSLITGYGAKTASDKKEVLVEKETGANYVRYNGRLHPVANFTSAILIAGTSETRRVARSSLLGQERGPKLGLPDAPDSLPGPKELNSAPWSVCSGKINDQAQSVLFVGRAPAGGAELPDGHAVVVKNSAGRYGLIWRRPGGGGLWKYDMPNATEYRSYISVATAVDVTPALLNAFQAGSQSIGRLDLPNKGKPSTRFEKHKIGEVIEKSDTGSKELFVVRDRKMSKVTEFQADLLLNDPEYSRMISPLGVTRLSSTAFNSLAPADVLDVLDAGTLPATKPVVVEASKSLCGTVKAGEVVNSLRYGIELPNLPAETGGVAPGGASLADRVDMEPGKVVLVESVTTPGVPGTMSLVTGGRQYALTDPKVKEMLGYGKVRNVLMPASLVKLIPSGSSLDVEAAAKQFGAVPTPSVGP